MKFTITTTKTTYHSGSVEPEYKAHLRRLGFSITTEIRKFMGGSEYECAVVSGSPEIEIGTIEDLVNLSKELDNEILVDGDNLELEIYDGYRE